MIAVESTQDPSEMRAIRSRRKLEGNGRPSRRNASKQIAMDILKIKNCALTVLNFLFKKNFELTWCAMVELNRILDVGSSRRSAQTVRLR